MILKAKQVLHEKHQTYLRFLWFPLSLVWFIDGKLALGVNVGINGLITHPGGISANNLCSERLQHPCDSNKTKL